MTPFKTSLRSLLSCLLRLLALALLATFVHLLLLWLWNPMVKVSAPRLVQVQVKSLGPSSSDDKEAVLLFGGDTAPTDAALPMIQRFGYEYPFSATLDLLQGADLSLVNLEAPVTTRQVPFPLYKNYVYKVSPQALPALTWAGIKAVTLANNHIMDYQVDGLVDTLTHLDAAQVVPLGGGMNIAEARRGVVFLIRGFRVGILNYLEDSFMDSLYVRSFADLRRPGCNRLELRNIKEDISRLRQYAELVIVVAHWGRNYTGITLLQRFYGRQLIDAGADAVIGHHPHQHQPVALYRGKPILYSLGNYAFGTPGRESLRYGLLARLRIRERRIHRIELIPLLTQNAIIQFKPEQVVGDEARQMLQELAGASARLGAQIKIAEGIGILDI